MNCQGCGNFYEDDYDVYRCDQCPPEICTYCHQISDWESGAYCSCWKEIGSYNPN